MSKDEEEPKDPEILRSIRTNAKRRHTKLANGLMALMDDERGTEKVSVALAVLQEAYDEVVRVNARYMEVVKDKAPEAGHGKKRLLHVIKDVERAPKTI